ncbi:uncharacterized protein [Hetaerina americana]|uniref:uncharacterized protein n=1 Tax=Hetaerina americana TaxID=62018 RepID=UPI003A7F5191
MFGCCCDYVVPFTRFWGIITAVVMSGVGVDLTYHGHKMGIYFLVSAAVVFFLEITWAITMFLQVCLRHDDGCGGGCLRCWKGVLWCGSWKKGILYALAGAAILIRPYHLWLTPASGGMLLFLAVLYFLLTLKARLEAKDALLAGRDDSYDRFEEVLDDTMPEPLSQRGYMDTNHHILIQPTPSTSGTPYPGANGPSTSSTTSRTNFLVNDCCDHEILLEI